MSVLNEQAEVVVRLFRNLFECDGRRFGSPSLGVLGISDGVEGVQWNAGCRRDGTAWLGVNLEGMQYDNWPVARLIEREISHPLLLSAYRPRVARPEMVRVGWTRDAWQYPGRVSIKEADLEPTPIALNQLDGDGWARALRLARECLDPKRHHRGRRRANVTLVHTGCTVERWVSPHLQFKNRLADSSPRPFQRAKENLEVLHEFATHQARPVRYRED